MSFCQNDILVGELFLEYTIYFPKCYRYFINENGRPNRAYLIVSNDTILYNGSDKKLTMKELEDVSNCWVMLEKGQSEEQYLIGLFKYLINRYRFTEEVLEQEYALREDN